APRPPPPSPPGTPSCPVSLQVNKVINYGTTFDASTCDHLASFASIVYLQHASVAALSAATATSAASVASRFTCTFSSPSVMIVSAVLSGSQANTSFFQALSNVAAAQLLAISFDLACGDSVSAFSVPVQYTQGHCDHLAFYSNIMYLADIPRNTLTGPRLLSNFTCFFFSTNTLIVVASVREAAASSTFFSAFNNTMAAELAGVAFNLGCSCRVDGGNTCCTMGMNKVDFNVAPDCQRSVQDVTMNGEPASPAIFERTIPVMKITGLMTPYATGLIDGVEVCFTLDETSNCPTLSSLCGGTVCRYAVYNEPQRYNCCPVSTFDAPQ
ncbi:DUF3707 domain-containing protein, partial [Haematococcus lacustris]